MFSRHVSDQLAALMDGELTPRETAQVERHAAECVECRAERELVAFGMAAMAGLDVSEPPEEVWRGIEEAWEANARAGRVHLGETDRGRSQIGAGFWELLAAVGRLTIGRRLTTCPTGKRRGSQRNVSAWAAAVLAVIGVIYWIAAPHRWIETGSQSSASIRIGAIGSVEVLPNTRVRVVTERPGEYRLALARGEIRAKISAPPRLFFVDTASGTAVDLGCEYALKEGEDGFGLLRVTKGWVSFQWKGMESLVPAGASCRTRPQVGPGIPYFDDAPESFQQALERGDLETILAGARVRDTLSLWHLLARVGGADRARVYDRIAALTPVPAGVSREQALRLDPETLRRWKEELAWTW